MIRPLFFLALLVIVITGCHSDRTCSTSQQLKQWMSDDGRIKVLCTIAMIEDLVKVIGGDNVDTISLISGQLDPHSYQLVKGDDEKLQFAQVIFYNGLGLEHGPSLQQYLNEPKALAIGGQIRVVQPGLILDFGGRPDPHIWMDISLWANGIDAIVDKLSTLDASHKADYVSRGNALRKIMLDKHEEVRNIMQSIPPEKRYLVTSHDAFNYFARAYMATPDERSFRTWGERVAAPEGLAPESQLSTTDIQQIIAHLIKFHIEVIFPESNVSRDSIRKIVQAGKEKGLNLSIASDALYGDAMGCPGSPGDTYLKMIEYNARTIASYLK